MTVITHQCAELDLPDRRYVTEWKHVEYECICMTPTAIKSGVTALTRGEGMPPLININGRTVIEHHLDKYNATITILAQYRQNYATDSTN